MTKPDVRENLDNFKFNNDPDVNFIRTKTRNKTNRMLEEDIPTNFSTRCGLRKISTNPTKIPERNITGIIFSIH